jgi:iron complex transport system substrate-binding protein
VRQRLLLFLFLPLLLIGAACSDGDDNDISGASAAVEIKGTDGVTVTLTEAPKRIVSLAPHATEIICAIDAGGSLAAVDKFANCPAGSKSKPEVDGFTPSVEAIAALQPDFVYMVFDPGEVAASLRRLDIKVLNLDVPSSLDGVFEHIELWGRITGNEDDAKELVGDMQKQRDDVLRSVPSSGGPRYFHELDAELFTVRDDTFEGSLYALLKAKSIAKGTDSPYPQLSTEAVISRDPEVIVLLDGQTAADVRSRAGWQNVSAVRSGKICELDPDLLSRPGPNIVDGLAELKDCLYD